MFEYKSEILKIKAKGLNAVIKSIVENIDDVAELDELINVQASEGWELVTHSPLVDTLNGLVKIIVTFRRLM